MNFTRGLRGGCKQYLCDRCIGAFRFVIARPPLAAGIALTLALLRPRRALKWARRAFGLWQSYRWLTKKAAA